MKKSCFKFPDGRQLTWYEAGQGRPLVLLHGWSISAVVFSEVAALLSSGYRLLIPDLPGHGESSPALQNDLAGISDDLVCWIRSIENAPVTLVGWSLGGMLSMEITHQHKLPVDRLVLIGTTPRFTQYTDWSFGLPSVQVRALIRNLERSFEAALGNFFSLTFAGEKISKERLRMIRTFAVRQGSLPDPDVALDLLKMLGTQDQREIISEIQQPALVLHGNLDQITPVAAGRYLAEKLPLGDFVEFTGVGHGAFMSQPREVAEKIQEFCR